MYTNLLACMKRIFQKNILLIIGFGKCLSSIISKCIYMCKGGVLVENMFFYCLSMSFSVDLSAVKPMI